MYLNIGSLAVFCFVCLNFEHQLAIQNTTNGSAQFVEERSKTRQLDQQV